VQLPGTPLAARTAPRPDAGMVPASVHRSPVVSLDGKIIGYTVTVDPAPGVDVDAVYLELDLPNLVADRYAFLPSTPAMLEGFVPTPAVPGRLVLDLPVGFAATTSAEARAAALRALGMALALVDYRGAPAQRELLPFLAFVVVDPRSLHDGPSLAELVHDAHRHGVRVLARDAVTPALVDACRAAGVDGLRGGTVPLDAHVANGLAAVPTQRTEPPAAPGHPGPAGRHAAGPPDGVGHARPQQGSGARVLRAGEAQCLTILDLLSRPEVSVSDVAQVIETDPVLTLRVLHLVNSGAYALSHQVDTVHQAVVLLGPVEVSTLVTALALDARPDAMDRLWFILARAATCEALSDDTAGYTVGMLSALAEQLELPVPVLLEKVGVSSLVADAIAEGAGPLGAVLRAVRAHEQSDVEGVIAAGHDPVAVSQQYMHCLRDALAIARAVTREG